MFPTSFEVCVGDACHLLTDCIEVAARFRSTDPHIFYLFLGPSLDVIQYWQHYLPSENIKYADVIINFKVLNIKGKKTVNFFCVPGICSQTKVEEPTDKSSPC